jgi:hypothetical protein
MTPDELMKPLSPIESAELSTAAAQVLTVAGVDLLRRLMFENDTLRANANAAKVEAYEGCCNLLSEDAEIS